MEGRCTSQISRRSSSISSFRRGIFSSLRRSVKGGKKCAGSSRSSAWRWEANDGGDVNMTPYLYAAPTNHRGGGGATPTTMAWRTSNLSVASTSSHVDYMPFLRVKAVDVAMDRRWVHDRLRRHVRGGGGDNVLIVQGGEGSGKTTVVRSLRHLADCQHLAATTSEQFIRSTIRQLGNNREFGVSIVDEGEEDDVDDAKEAWLRDVVKPLRRSSKPGLMLIDGQDGEEIFSFVMWAVRQLPPTMRIIMSSSVLHAHLPTVHLDDPTDARVLQDSVDYIRRRTPHARSTFVDRLVRVSQCNVLHMRLVLDLLDGGHLSFKSDTFSAMPSTIRQCFLLIFNLKFATRAQYNCVAPLLGVLATADDQSPTISNIAHMLDEPYIEEVIAGVDDLVFVAVDRTVGFVHGAAMRRWLTGERHRYVVDVAEGRRRWGRGDRSIDQADTLSIAIRRDDAAAVHRFLAGTTDVRCVDAEGRTPLHTAAMHAGKEVNEALLRQEGTMLNEGDTNGHRAIDLAVVCGNLDAVHVYLRRGARLSGTTWQMAEHSTAAHDALIGKLVDDAHTLIGRRRGEEAMLRLRYARKRCRPRHEYRILVALAKCVPPANSSEAYTTGEVAITQCTQHYNAVQD